ncbi:MAG: transglycosylase SLT domain-containing protein [Bacteroidetes bacterium]|nr:transglycosylase SLT domain-containing protein [Bacteroidota bacterium]
MRRTILGLAAALVSAASWAQAPVGSVMETSLSRIDSLTQVLYQEIPSHVGITDTASGWIADEKTFQSRMNMLGTTINMDYNAFVTSHVRYLMMQNETFYDGLHKRMQLYFPIYEQVLDRYNLPQELKYVSIIESNLYPNAQSWCGASGLWQFMPYTGRSMGMRIDYTIDERKSIIRSTEKACEYFRNSYNQFGDWLLAIASYNCGAGYVQRAINLSGGSKDFWKIKNFLPKETQNYVPKFIAAAYVLNFTKYSKTAHNQTSSLLVPTEIKPEMSLKYLAKYLGVNEEDIAAYNRELITKSTPGNAPYKVMLPYELSMRFMENTDSAYAFAVAEKAAEDAKKPVYVQKWVPYYHYVTRGQTLYTIARRYGTTVNQLKAWNGLKTNVAPAGRNLVLYKLSWVNAKQG